MITRLLSAFLAVVFIGGCIIRDDTAVPVPVPADPTPDVNIRVPDVNVKIKS